MNKKQQKGGKYTRDEMVQHLVKMKIKDKASTGTLLDWLINEHKYAKSYAYELVREARVYIGETYKEWNMNALEEALADLAEQKEDAKRQGNTKLLFEITKEENKLKGLYTEKIEVSGALKIETIKLKEVVRGRNEDYE